MTAASSAEKLELTAQAREITGQKVNKLRHQGSVPAVVYGKGMDAKNLQVDVEAFDEVYEKAGESTLVYLKVGSDSFPTIIADVHRHPVSGAYIHVDFQKVRLDEKVVAEVQLVFVGESQAVKDGGILVKNLNAVEVEALPQDLPPEIEVDISSLKEIDDHISLKAIKLDKAEILGHEGDEIIATIHAPKTEEELEAELAEPTTDVDAVEVEGAEGVEGEEAPAAEGEEKPAEEAPAEEKTE